MRFVSAVCAALSATLFLSLAASAADEEENGHDPGFNEKTFESLQWRAIGPAKMSGRIADIAIDPNDRDTWYVGVGSGGVWKTVNAGTTWTPIFDEEKSYSIGCITIDPNNAQTIWVGSGENVSGRHVGYGDGVYRSLDGGDTWENMGLTASEHIGMIRIDPRDSDVVYVAAQGPLWSRGGDRGLYKSTDAGRSWEKILSDGPYTGVNEVHLDPRNPDVLYAVAWQRMRTVAALMDGGPETAIYKSTDAGENWTKLKKGLPKDDMGKIGFAISPQNPDVVYAGIELANRKGGFYRSDDGGGTWEKQSDYVAGGTGPHYYQEVFASPHRFDHIYHMDVFMHVSTDGGKTFEKTRRNKKHVDHHALAFVPGAPDFLVAGTDGGLYVSHDAGENWRFSANLPVTQFYKVAVDYDEPFYNIYGGTQDNNSQGGPSRTTSLGGIVNDDWRVVLAGDGHQPAADPTNPDIVYAQWQQGNLTRYDRRTGESIYIRPQPEKGEDQDRFNWDAPILVSPHNAETLFFASQRLWRSDDRGDSWEAISGDLTRNINRLGQPIMGRTWSFDSVWDLYAMSKYSTIANLSQSPLDAELLYVGTDDGLIQVSEDGGDTWRRVAGLPGVPEYYYVNDIKADLHDENTVYVAVDNHKGGDFRPYLLRSTDRGRSWVSIASDLPDRHVVWRIVQDHVKPELLFAGTEFGVFFSIDTGGSWVKLTGGAPNIPFRDLAIQRRENDLVGATFGRGFYVLDDYSPLRTVTAEMLAGEATLFPVRKAPWYVPRRPLGCSEADCVASQGADYFTMPNPPFGAVFTYYLPEKIRSAKEQRREREKSLAKAGRDLPFPGWDTLTGEALQDEPAVVLTVRDGDGNVVRHVEGPGEAGFHRVAWDLRYPPPDPWKPEPELDPWEPVAGTLAAPGSYGVTLATRIDGVLEAISRPRRFQVVSIRKPGLEGIAQEERVSFMERIDELERRAAGAVSAIDELVGDTAAIKQTLAGFNADPQLYVDAQRIEQRARRLRDRLAQNDQRSKMGDEGPMPIQSRLYVAGWGDRTQAHGPTATQRRSLEIAVEEFAEVSSELTDLIDGELEALHTALDAGGVPWTPGRGVPAGGI